VIETHVLYLDERWEKVERVFSRMEIIMRFWGIGKKIIDRECQTMEWIMQQVPIAAFQLIYEMHIHVLCVNSCRIITAYTWEFKQFKINLEIIANVILSSYLST
jgi:hypothetical protein